MKLLMVCTNPDVFLNNTGTKARLEKLFKSFSYNNNIIFLTPMLNKRDKGRYTIKDFSHFKIYYFRQWSIPEKYLALFTDFNFDFLRKIRRIIFAEKKIDIIFISLPHGVVLTSLFCHDIPLIYGSEFVIHGTSSRLLSTNLAYSYAIFRNNFIGKMFSKVLGLLSIQYLSFIEQMACKRASHIIAISESDKQKIIDYYDIENDKITVIPHYINSSEFHDVSSHVKKSTLDNIITIIFHGSFKGHPANYNAFMSILEYIAPEIEKKNGNIKFLLAGSDVPVFERRNVKSIGFVEDIPNFLKNADIAIVPFSEGSGIKIKIFDYMAAGLPIIVTKNGIEGIDMEHGKHAIIIDTVNQQFIDAILDLASDKNKREVIGRNVLELARTKYKEEIVKTEIDKMLFRITSNHRNQLWQKKF